MVSLCLGSASCHSDLLQNKKSYFPVSPMDFCLEEFLPRRLLPQKDPLAKNECPRNVSPYLVRAHVVWQSADIPKFNHLGNLFTENVMTQTRNSNSSETLLLINLLMFSTSSDMCPLLKTRHITKKKSHKVNTPNWLLSIYLGTYGLLCSGKNNQDLRWDCALRVSD